MQYLPLFLLFMATLIAAYFYLERAKARRPKSTAVDEAAEPTAPAAPASTDQGE